MSTIKAQAAFIHSTIEYNLWRLGVNTRDEEGAVSTETALITAGLILVGGTVAGILLTRGENFADCIPDPDGTQAGTNCQ